MPAPDITAQLAPVAPAPRAERPLWQRTILVVAGTALALAAAGCSSDAGTQETSAGVLAITGDGETPASASATPEADGLCDGGFDYKAFKANKLKGVAPNSLFSGLSQEDPSSNGTTLVSTETGQSEMMQQACESSVVTAVLGSFVVNGQSNAAKFNTFASLGGVEKTYDRLETDKSYARKMLKEIQSSLPFIVAVDNFTAPSGQAKVLVPVYDKQGNAIGMKYKKANLTGEQQGFEFGYNTDNQSLTAEQRNMLDKQKMLFMVNKFGQWIVTKIIGEDAKVSLTEEETDKKLQAELRSAAPRVSTNNNGGSTGNGGGGSSSGNNRGNNSNQGNNGGGGGGSNRGNGSGSGSGTHNGGGGGGGSNRGNGSGSGSGTHNGGGGGGGNTTPQQPQPQPEQPQQPQPQPEQPQPQPQPEQPQPQPTQPADNGGNKGAEPGPDCQNNPNDPRC